MKSDRGHTLMVNIGWQTQDMRLDREPCSHPEEQEAMMNRILFRPQPNLTRSGHG